ncbi:hypothetical protein FBU30_007192 [Linnemannia zychae]|nr:hypothetical protein FBU30_007192 [Linnemannia zychae]
MSMLRLQRICHGIDLGARTITRHQPTIPRTLGHTLFQQPKILFYPRKSGQPRYYSEALLQEKHEAIEAIESKIVRQRRKLKANEGDANLQRATATTTAALPRKLRCDHSSTTQQITEEASENIVSEAVVKKTRKKSTKNKETSETAATDTNESVAGQTPVIATKKKRARKSPPLPLETAVASAVKTELRPYQQECIDACLARLKEGYMRQIVSLPVGSGKTVIFSHLMKQIPSPHPGATKTLILAHRQELLEQTRNHVLRNGVGLTVSIDQGKREADMRADVIVASVPTLGRAGTTRILKYNPQEFKCIIIDEAHHAAAESYGRILEHFGANVPNTHIFVYGCSATVRRHDGLRLGGVFDYIPFHKGFINMIEDKWLCGLRVSTIQTELDLKNVKTQGDDFAIKDLSLKVNTPLRNDVIVRSYMTYCAERKSTVVFAVDIEHLETLAETFRKYGYDARGLSSKTDDEERAQMLKDFREQKFPIIVNCGILTEGTDIPVIDSIIMARPTKSNVLFQQMLGRGMRLHPGKEDCLVLDFVDVVKGDGLVTLPTLLGLDTASVLKVDKKIESQEDIDAIRKERIDQLESESISDLEDSVDFSTAKIARIKVLEYENPYQLIGDCSGTSRRIATMSNNAWVNVGGDAYVLTCRNVIFRIERSEDGLFRCYKNLMIDKRDKNAEKSQMLAELRRNMRRRPKQDSAMFRTKENELPIEADSLESCFRGVDTWITNNIGHFPEVLSRYAKWRKFPATESQLRFLRKLGYDHDPLDDIGGNDLGDGKEEPNLAKELEMTRKKREEIAARKLTKGQAANMITRLVHGAGKRWTESKRFQAKRAKAMAREIGVEVGPIPKTVDV